MPRLRGGLLLTMALYSNPRLLQPFGERSNHWPRRSDFQHHTAGRSPGPSMKRSPTSCAIPTSNQRDRPITLYFRKIRRRIGDSIEQGLEIVLCDRGPAIDPGKFRGRALDEIRPGGLGLHLIHEAMDKVEFTRRVVRTGCGSSSICQKPVTTSEGENTVQISVRRSNTTTIFDVSGDIDFREFSRSPRVPAAEIREIRASRVLVNLTAVRYIDSSGVASLVEGLKASRDYGSRLILFGLSIAAREVLQLSRLLKVFEVYDSEEEALAH